MAPPYHSDSMCNCHITPIFCGFLYPMIIRHRLLYLFHFVLYCIQILFGKTLPCGWRTVSFGIYKRSIFFKRLHKQFCRHKRLMRFVGFTTGLIQLYNSEHHIKEICQRTAFLPLGTEHSLLSRENLCGNRQFCGITLWKQRKHIPHLRLIAQFAVCHCQYHNSLSPNRRILRSG